LAFGAAGYLIGKATYINANDPEKAMGRPILPAALIVGVAPAAISSLTVLGNRLLHLSDAS
jgi:hypothetical protein